MPRAVAMPGTGQAQRQSPLKTPLAAGPSLNQIIESL